MQLQISAEEALEIIRQRITNTSSVLKTSDIDSIRFNYDNIREEVTGITVELKSNVYIGE